MEGSSYEAIIEKAASWELLLKISSHFMALENVSTPAEFALEWDHYRGVCKAEERDLHGGTPMSVHYLDQRFQALLPIFHGVFVIGKKFNLMGVIGTRTDPNLTHGFFESGYSSPMRSAPAAEMNSSSRAVNSTFFPEFTEVSAFGTTNLFTEQESGSQPPLPSMEMTTKQQPKESFLDKDFVVSLLVEAMLDETEIHDRTSDKPTDVYRGYLRMKDVPETPDFFELAWKIVSYMEELHADHSEVHKLTLEQRLEQVLGLLKRCKGTVFNLTKLSQFQRCILNPQKEEKVFENNQLSNLNKKKKDEHYSKLLDATGAVPPVASKKRKSAPTSTVDPKPKRTRRKSTASAIAEHDPEIASAPIAFLEPQPEIVSAPTTALGLENPFEFSNLMGELEHAQQLPSMFTAVGGNNVTTYGVQNQNFFEESAREYQFLEFEDDDSPYPDPYDDDDEFR
ncbi:hypothetical protein RUND412_009705 [Rhizina undulata]